MAYVSQERKADLVKLAKPVLKKYGVKGTFAVDNHSTIVCNIKSGKIDFIKNINDTLSSVENVGVRGTAWTPHENYIDVNVYHYDKHFSGDALAFLTELITALQTGNHDNSDIQTDYFDVGWYVDVNIGRWNKPYILEK
jgi:hypothetical protein